MMDYGWMATCATAGEFLYGYFPVDVLRQMYEKKKGCKASAQELIAAMKELEEKGEVLVTHCPGRMDESDNKGIGFYYPTECEGTAFEEMMRKADAEGNPYASIHLSEDERSTLILDRPEDLEFYVPDEREITQLVEEGYIWTSQMGKLESAIREQGGDPEYLKGIWGQVSTDKMDQFEFVNAVMAGMFPEAHKHKDATDGSELSDEEMAKIPTMDSLNAVMPCINDFLNNINLRARKGWKPAELFKKMHPNGLTQMPVLQPGSVHAAKTFKEAEPMLREMGVTVDYSSISNYATVGKYGERHVIKVGRNDPCPCGSGLKYKRCHGK